MDCINGCLGFLGLRVAARHQEDSSSSRRLSIKVCDRCKTKVVKGGVGSEGASLCRRCCREGATPPRVLSVEAEQALDDFVSGVVDKSPPWSYWTPSKQPGLLRDWLYLHDLSEAHTDICEWSGRVSAIEAIHENHIRAVSNGTYGLKGTPHVGVQGTGDAKLQTQLEEMIAQVTQLRMAQDANLGHSFANEELEEKLAQMNAEIEPLERTVLAFAEGLESNFVEDGKTSVPQPKAAWTQPLRMCVPSANATAKKRAPASVETVTVSPSPSPFCQGVCAVTLKKSQHVGEVAEHGLHRALESYQQSRSNKQKYQDRRLIHAMAKEKKPSPVTSSIAQICPTTSKPKARGKRANLRPV